MIFPGSGGTRLLLDVDPAGARLPVVRWVGELPAGADEAGLLAAAGPQRGAALLVEHAHGRFERPGLRGHRLGERMGQDWSPAFTACSVRADGDRLTVEAADPAAGLALRTEVEALPGGALRARHRLTNTGSDPYLLEALEVGVPVPDDRTELLDFTGRHEHEREPQRRPVTDGLWVRESRGGRPGLDSATMLVAGTPGFGFGHGSVIGIALAWSGNATMALSRSGASGAVLSGGELLLPGELVLGAGGSYTTPWLVIAAADDGLDGLAARLHAWQRALPAHPSEQPVTLNVWEAVYFDHDAQRLCAIADRAARIGVERFVLDDGWFRGRRHARAGLGDWHVDEDVWPQGLTPLIEHVRASGMRFGLWFEPEMINPDSDLYRDHPDWVLTSGDRVPLLERDQFVVDLTNPDAFDHLLARLDAVLSQNAVDYVKWDHNRELLEAGTRLRGGAPAVHEQTLAFYRLLDELRARHPAVAFESCASGGGRIDLGVVEKVQRFWTSDLTDARARQHIQRWTAQLIAPEYLGAHVSAPSSHQTGRTYSLDFRAATALFGSFGLEWDLTTAGEGELDRLAEWIARYRRWRPLLHTGRMVRLDLADPAALAHGVIAADRRRALFAYVQLDEAAHSRGVTLRLPGLEPGLRYRCSWAAPPDAAKVSRARPLDPAGPTGGAPVSGAALARVGLWLPRRRPETVVLIELAAD